MFYVYILVSLKDGKLYTGFTRDLKRRIVFHDSGESRATKGRLPVKLIYCEMYINEGDAKARERFLKSGRGREVIKNQIKDTLAGIV